MGLSLDSCLLYITVCVLAVFFLCSQENPTSGDDENRVPSLFAFAFFLVLTEREPPASDYSSLEFTSLSEFASSVVR